MGTFQSCGFTVEILPGLPGDSDLPIFQFARPEQSTHSEGLVIRVSKLDQKWVANFQSGRFFGGLDDVVLFHASPVALVFSGGQGFQVPLDSPRSFEIIRTFPVLGVHYLNETDRAIIWDFTRFTAYSAEGMDWKTGPIPWDGLKIEDVRSGQLTGWAWDALNEAEVEFELDLLTGRHTGGAPNIPKQFNQR